MQKILLLAIFSLLAGSRLSAQTINPYNQFGYEPKNKYVTTAKTYTIKNKDAVAEVNRLVIDVEKRIVFLYNKDSQQVGQVKIEEKNMLRFLSVDPITGQYPQLTPYQFASNRPIDGIDQDGLEWELSTVNTNLGQTQIELNSAYKRYNLPWLNPNNRDVLVADMYGRGVMGKVPDVKVHIAEVKRQHDEAIANNITGGPLGAAGYLIAGDKGSYVGATFDQIGFSFAGVPEQNGYLARPKGSTTETYVPTSGQAVKSQNGNTETTANFITGAAKTGLALESSVSKVLGSSYKAMGEVTVSIKNTALLEQLNAASKGDWMKVYEAGLQNGNKIETHYFRNNTTGEVFDVKPKYNYWHQKAFKKIGE